MTDTERLLAQPCPTCGALMGERCKDSITLGRWAFWCVGRWVAAVRAHRGMNIYAGGGK